MAVLNRLKRLVETVTDNVSFALAYIDEAHASDTWALGYPGALPSHKSMEDRYMAARSFKEEHFPSSKLKVLADDFDNSWSKKYKSWPWRFWAFSLNESGQPIISLVSDLKLNSAGDPNFDFGDLEKFLEPYRM